MKNTLKKYLLAAHLCENQRAIRRQRDDIHLALLRAIISRHDAMLLPPQKLFLQQNPSQSRLLRLSQKPLLPKQKRLQPKKPLKLQKRLIPSP